MTSSKTKPKLEEIVPAIASVQKLLKFLRKLGLKLNVGDDHLRNMRVLAEKHAVISPNKK